MVHYNPPSLHGFYGKYWLVCDWIQNICPPKPIDQVGLRFSHVVVFSMGANYKMGVDTPTGGFYKMAARSFRCVDVKCAIGMGCNPFCRKWV